jgi:hypothetical protein
MDVQLFPPSNGAKPAAPSRIPFADIQEAPA